MSETSADSSNHIGQKALEKSEPRATNGLVGVTLTHFTFDRLLVMSGLLVFVAASFFGLVSLTAGVLMDASVEGKLSWHHMRALELYLMTASVGVVVAIMASSRNAFVVTIGIVLIGALIVPSRDMVRFALIFTDSVQKIDELYPECDAGPNCLGAIMTSPTT